MFFELDEHVFPFLRELGTEGSSDPRSGGITGHAHQGSFYGAGWQEFERNIAPSLEFLRWLCDIPVSNVASVYADGRRYQHERDKKRRAKSKALSVRAQVPQDMFVAIDVETANADAGSICQIGIAEFGDAAFTNGWKSLVDPEDYFDAVNVSIHGIDEQTVSGAPTFVDVANDVSSLVQGKVLVCHTAFDRLALRRACERYGVSEPPCKWLDSARAARRVWPQFAQRGYGLSNLASFLECDFRHHDALEDAKAAGHIVLAALRESGLDIDGLLERASSPLTPSRIRLDGNTEGPLFGERVVFTGALEMPRREAAALAAKLGCDVLPGVTKKTTLLVVGDQDVAKLAGHSKSRKHRRAEELISEGVPIRILRESDFQRLIELDPS